MKTEKKKSFWRYWMKLLIFSILVFVLGILVGLPLVSAYGLTRSSHHAVCCQTPSDWGFLYEDVVLTADDGVRLYGWYIPSQNDTAVILLHGYGGDRFGSSAYARMLAAQGYGVLMYDQRATGESEGKQLTYGWLDIADVNHAVRYVQNRPDVNPQKIGVMGCSMGAEIAIASAAQNDSIQAVIADAPFHTTFRDVSPPANLEDVMNILMFPSFFKFMEWFTGSSAPMPLTEAVTQIAPRPLLIISAGTGFEQRQGDYIFSFAQEPKTVWNIPEATHCSGPTTRQQEYEERVLEFFDQALLKD
ncbi:MAG: alpha/beta fold hydrolase [Anaerolinea sp.]|nr:alpha/beta fold hydrolase [Anaerolinea sp.]